MTSADRPSSPTSDSHETLPAPPRSSAAAFGEYDVVGELGEGGMGRVYKAVDRNLGRFVAVKVLRSSDPFECNRFRGEAELIAMLDHPNIIKIFAIETTPDGRPYLVLEFAEGGSLDRELAGQPQEPRRAAEMTETLARAVHFAHEKGVIHRDLKPANVLRGKDKALKLTDFGLAKELEVSSGMTPSGAVMGTPSYMAPEQAEGKVKQLGPPTDVYGLGAILYEMLTGRPPFRGVNMVDTLEQVRWAEPAPPSRLVPRLHRDLATICLKCLHKSPGRRYQTAGELADDLRRWLNGETIAARPAPSWERLARQVRRRPWQAATLAASALVVALFVFGWVLMQRKAAEDLRRTEREAVEAKARDEQLAADHRLHAAEQRRAAELAAVHELTKERLSKQARGSLAALNKIRALVLDGELSRKPDLEPLYTALSGYYSDLILQNDTGFDKVELADGLVKVGDLFGRTGQKAQAQAAYAKAADQCRPLAADPQARKTLAAALLKGGQVAYDLDDARAVEGTCTELAALHPDTTDPVAHPLVVSQIAETHHLRGQLLLRRGEFEMAGDAFQLSILHRGRLTESVPADLATLPAGERARALAALTDLGRGYGWLGDALLDAGKPADAETAYWKSHAIRQRVADAFSADDRGGGALDARCQLARSWGNFATLHTRSRALGTARYFALQSLAAHVNLVDLDKVNVEFKLDVCARLVQVAELDILLWMRPGVTPDDRVRAEIASNLAKAKDVPEDQLSAPGKRSRRAEGILATVHVLQGVMLMDTDPQKALVAVRRGNDLLGGLCKPPAGVKPEPIHLYYREAARTLLCELNQSALPPGRRKERLDGLKGVVEQLGINCKHPDEVEQFRAFRFLADDPEFKPTMDALRTKSAAKATAKAP